MEGSVNPILAITGGIPLKSLVERNRRWISWAVSLPMLGYLLISPINETSHLSAFMEYGGFFLLIVAAVGRIWTSLYISGRKDTQLITDGPFSLCRNPLYLFSFIGVEGFVLASENPLLALLMIPIFWGYYHFVIQGEEKRLGRIFGANYDLYCKNTPRIFPRFSNFHSRTVVDIDLRVMKSVLLDASCFLLLIVLIELLEQFKLS